MSDQTAVLPDAQTTMERCTGCGKPMAEDQRYCLNCGKRRGKARVEFENYLPEAGGEGNGVGAPPPPTQGEVRPVPPEEYQWERSPRPAPRPVRWEPVQWQPVLWGPAVRLPHAPER